MNVPEDNDEEEEEFENSNNYENRTGTLDTRAMSNDSIRPQKPVKVPRQDPGQSAKGFCGSGKEKPCALF